MMENSTVLKRPIRRLFFDIETSPNVVFSWRVGHKINLSPDNIIEERKIICIGYKWQNQKKVTVLKWNEHQNDKEMLEKFIKVIDDADELVFQNGDRFDLPWVKTRCIYHGLPPISDSKTCDTLKLARRNFYFNSNRLDYMAKFLGIGQKIHTGFDLWKDIVLKNSPKALAKMCQYCAHDVILLEKVWDKLKLFVKQKTHEGVMTGKEKWSCPSCGGNNVKKSKTKVSAVGTISHQMQCLNDGHYFTISESEYQDYKESKGK